MLVTIPTAMHKQIGVAAHDHYMSRTAYVNAVLAAALSLEPACRRSIAADIRASDLAEPLRETLAA
jgi:hypothetical protein